MKYSMNYISLTIMQQHIIHEMNFNCTHVSRHVITLDVSLVHECPIINKLMKL